MSFPYILYPDSCPVKWRDQHNVMHSDVHPNDDYDDKTWRNEGRAISGFIQKWDRLAWSLTKRVLILFYVLLNFGRGYNDLIFKKERGRKDCRENAASCQWFKAFLCTKTIFSNDDWWFSLHPKWTQ